MLDQDDSITDDYLKEQLNAIESADISVCNPYFDHAVNYDTISFQDLTYDKGKAKL